MNLLLLGPEELLAKIEIAKQSANLCGSSLDQRANLVRPGERKKVDAGVRGESGACFLAYLDREGLANVGAWFSNHTHRTIDVPKYEFGIFGLILVITMLFRPEGLIPSQRRAAEFHEGVHDDPLYESEHAGA